GAFPTLGGTLSASGITGLTVNGLSSSTGSSTAVNLVNSDGSFTFQSISTSGASVGIKWDNSSGTTATGSFTVSGNGGSCTSGSPTCSGGSIQTSGLQGIFMDKAANLNFSLMKIQGSVAASSAGLYMQDIGGTVTLANDLVTGTSG